MLHPSQVVLVPAGLGSAASSVPHAAPFAELLPTTWLGCCRANGVDVVTLGQYMRPTKKHMAVAEYVTPDAFAAYQKVRPAGQHDTACLQL